MVEARKFAAVVILFSGLAACSTVPPSYEVSNPAPRSFGAIQTPDQPLQCVAFAREHSGIGIHGDAWTWWDQAQGRYAREYSPHDGAVLILNGYAGPKRAHLAVVREVVSARQIRVDHANWLNDGRIYLDDPVVDVSPGNDWSEVRVYNLRDHGWGIRTYAVEGFISPRPPPERILTARRENAFTDPSQ